MIPRRMMNRLRALMSLLLAWRGVLTAAFRTAAFCTEQRGGNEIQHGGSALGDPLRRQGIESDDLLHHGSAAEIENDHGDDRGHKVRRIDRTEFAVHDSL